MPAKYIGKSWKSDAHRLLYSRSAKWELAEALALEIALRLDEPTNSKLVREEVVQRLELLRTNGARSL